MNKYLIYSLYFFLSLKNCFSQNSYQFTTDYNKELIKLHAIDSLLNVHKLKEKRNKNFKNKLLVLPVIAYQQETKLIIGGSIIKTFIPNKRDSLYRTSTASLIALYSLRNQYFLIYNGNQFFNKEKIILYNQLTTSSIFGKFWGFGNNSIYKNGENYVLQQTNFYNSTYFKVNRGFYLGFKVDFQREFNYKIKGGGLFQQNFSKIVQKNSTIAAGIGPLLSIDTRNDSYYPNKGWFVEFGYINYGKFIGSQLKFSITSLNIRKYLPLNKSRILALQVFTNFVTGKQINIRNYPRLGGISIFRGYFEGRFLDKGLWVIQGEYRSKLKWFKVNLDYPKLVVFTSVGDVFSQRKHVRLYYVKSAFGIGIRIPLLKHQKLHFRFDLAFNNWDKILSPPIIGFQESF